jgi:hypothetical protein
MHMQIGRLVFQFVWPRGAAHWYFWNERGMYRVGPFNFWLIG